MEYGLWRDSVVGVRWCQRDGSSRGGVVVVIEVAAGGAVVMTLK